MMSDLERRDVYVSNLQSALTDGQHGLSAVPGHIKQIIQEEMWQDRMVQATGERAQYDAFTQFVNDSPPKGLGASVDLLERMCDNDPEALRLLREVTTGEDGNPTGANQHSEEGGGSVDNINRSSGTSKSYTLDRLAREDAALYERVVDEEDDLSANQAAIKAGFRTKTVSVPVRKGGEPQLDRAAESIAKHFGEHLDGLLQRLQQEAG